MSRLADTDCNKSECDAVMWAEPCRDLVVVLTTLCQMFKGAALPLTVGAAALHVRDIDPALRMWFVSVMLPACTFGEYQVKRPASQPYCVSSASLLEVLRVSRSNLRRLRLEFFAERLLITCWHASPRDAPRDSDESDSDTAGPVALVFEHELRLLEHDAESSSYELPRPTCRCRLRFHKLRHVVRMLGPKRHLSFVCRSETHNGSTTDEITIRVQASDDPAHDHSSCTFAIDYAEGERLAFLDPPPAESDVHTLCFESALYQTRAIALFMPFEQLASYITLAFIREFPLGGSIHLDDDRGTIEFALSPLVDV